VTFRPGALGVVEECLNLWQGWGVVARPGDWSLIRQHIRVVIAGGNEEFAEYIERWIAWAIQNPAAQAEVALVLIGPKGAGKGTLVRLLQRIFGAHAFQVTSREEVIGKFNGHLQDCVLFVADEAYWGGDKRCVGRLQGMITEPTLPIERKGFDLIVVPNYLHVVMLAEPGWVIPAGRYERRYAAFLVSEARRRDFGYFKALHRQIAEGGAEAMMWDLQRMDLNGWHPREIPDNLLKGSALQQQQIHTLPPLEQWYLSLLRDARIPEALVVTDPKSKKISRPRSAFTRSLREDACERFPRLRSELSDSMLEGFMTNEDWPKAQKLRTSKANGWTFEPLAESRAAWEQRYGPQTWSAVVEWGEE
jgi:energy-coupling factor transporter ATP-binding protein EcfA2